MRRVRFFFFVVLDFEYQSYMNTTYTQVQMTSHFMYDLMMMKYLATRCTLNSRRMLSLSLSLDSQHSKHIHRNFDDRDLVLQSALWRELLPEHSNDPFDVDTSYYELLREVKSRGLMREDGTAVYQYHAMG